jgi:hypothetical protein
MRDRELEPRAPLAGRGRGLTIFMAVTALAAPLALQAACSPPVEQPKPGNVTSKVGGAQPAAVPGRRPATPGLRGGRMTPEQEGYVRRHLRGTGRYSRIIVQDQSVRVPTFETYETPRTDGEHLLATYIRDWVRADVPVEAVRDAPQAEEEMGDPVPSAPPRRARLRVFPIGVAIIALAYEHGPRIPGTANHWPHPYVRFYGDPASTGGFVTLKEYAPGDIPCRPYCRTGEQIFNSVKGRIDLILRNSLR